MNSYVLVTSVILNATLLMILYGVVPFLLFLSLVFNIALVWFIAQLIKDKKTLQEDFDNVFAEIDSLTEHLEDVHSLEAFYGDQTLQNLIRHSRITINSIIDFQEKHYEVEVAEDESEPAEAAQAPPVEE
tara:strand:+ start:1040 stop:1429 length:390 start_codon:yes stop_codon:yes gene_type:complete